MGRIRTIKPEFFKHSGLYDLEKETSLPLRVAFAGLWTCCDREGRFKWRPRELKLDILPYDECDFSRVLDALVTRGFIVKYESERVEYAYIPSWHSHQIINNKESASSLPNPAENKANKLRVNHASGTRAVRKGKEGKGNGKEQEGKEDTARSVPPEELAGTLPLVDGSEFPISKQQVAEWNEAFPGIDVKAQLKQAKAWLEANPTRKKTRRGVLRFAVNWLDRAQNKSGGGNGRQDQKRTEGYGRDEGGEDGPDLYAALYGTAG